MGPLNSQRKNTIPRAFMDAPESFNGAAELSAEKRRHASACYPNLWRFNGAAELSAEKQAERAAHSGGVMASMGPLNSQRKNPVAPAGAAPAGRFNGAAELSAEKR